MQDSGSHGVRRLNDILTQDSSGSLTSLTAEQLKTSRDRYTLMFRRHPEPEERPSNDQLSALVAKLNSDEPPSVDFAIIGPHGKRLQRPKRHKAMLWIDGQYITRQIDGPTSITDWLRSWRIFRNAMIMFGQASMSSLDAYEQGMVTLSMMMTCTARINGRT